MLTFIKQNVTPPGGFKYIDPDTKQEFKGPTLQVLARTVATHRASNDLEVPEDLPAVIEDWICQHLPPGLCKTPEGHVARRGLNYSTASGSIKASSAMSRIMRKAKRSPVSQKIANSRAVICAACDKNLRMSGCMGCRGIKDIIQEMRGGRGSSHDKRLRVCGVSGVLNHVQVFIDDRTIRETMKSSGEYPDNCWKLKTKGAKKNASRSKQD